MPVAIDTSILIAAEKQGGGLKPLLPVEETVFVLARGDKLLVVDSDFDRLKDRIKLLRPFENSSI